MARAHGFRVFVVEAYPNRAKGNSPLNAANDASLREEIEILLGRLTSKGTQRFEPVPEPDGSITKPTRTATVKFSTNVDQSLIHATMSAGETGSHSSATRPKKKTRDLRKWAPEVDHYLTFIFPTGRESRFLLVTQTVHRRDPHLRILSMLKDESIKLREERVAADKADRQAAIDRGERPAKLPTRKRLAFAAHQASDNEYLDEILSGANSATVVFKSKKMDARGGSEYVDRVLQIKLRDHNILDVGRTIGRNWASKWRAGNAPSHREAVSEVSVLLAEQDLLEQGEESRYESAAITVRSTSEASTTIAVDTLRDAFTYPISDIAPDPYAYYDRVSDRVAKIARQEDIEIQPIDPHEVSRCLTELTQAAS